MNKLFFKKLASNEKLKKTLGVLVKLFVSVFCVYLLSQKSDFNFYSIFEKTPEPFVWSMLILNQFFMCALSATKWSHFQKQSQEIIHWGKLFLISWVSQTVGLFAFGLLGTDGFRLTYLKKYEKKQLSSSMKNIFWDRLSSLGGLLIVLLVGLLCLSMGPSGLLGLLALFFIPKKWRYVLCLGTLLQATKTLSLILVYISFENAWSARWFELIFPMTTGLSLELIPVSFEGIGWGHFTFFQLLGSESGTLAYNGFFLSKVFFKSLGLLLLVPVIFYGLRTRKPSEQT